MELFPLTVKTLHSPCVGMGIGLRFYKFKVIENQVLDNNKRDINSPESCAYRLVSLQAIQTAFLAIDSCRLLSAVLKKLPESQKFSPSIKKLMYLSVYTLFGAYHALSYQTREGFYFSEIEKKQYVWVELYSYLHEIIFIAIQGAKYFHDQKEEGLAALVNTAFYHLQKRGGISLEKYVITNVALSPIEILGAALHDNFLTKTYGFLNTFNLFNYLILPD